MLNCVDLFSGAGGFTLAAQRAGLRVRLAIENDGDKVVDLHLWRLGPGHLGAIMSILTAKQRGAHYYRAKLARFRAVSHLTIEVVNSENINFVSPSAR